MKYRARIRRVFGRSGPRSGRRSRAHRARLWDRRGGGAEGEAEPRGSTTRTRGWSPACGCIAAAAEQRDDAPRGAHSDSRGRQGAARRPSGRFRERPLDRRRRFGKHMHGGAHAALGRARKRKPAYGRAMSLTTFGHARKKRKRGRRAIRARRASVLWRAPQRKRRRRRRAPSGAMRARGASARRPVGERRPGRSDRAAARQEHKGC